MRNVLLKIATILLVLLAACRPGRPSYVTAADARESVYKLKVSITLDLSPILQETDGSTQPLVVMNEKGRRLDASPLNRTADLTSAGTTWVVDRKGSASYLLTAGHVCETSATYPVRYIDWENWTVRTVELRVTKRSHTAVSYQGVEEDLVVIADEDLEPKTFAGTDLCLLGALADLGRPLPIADKDPEYASHSEVIGAPAGLWGGGVAVIADLKFSGRGNVWGGKVAESLAFTGDVIGGNSGSPIIHNGRVVALLNLGGVRFNELTTGVPWEELKKFFRKHMHRGLD